ncbi:MAG: hypothetical protein PHD74_06750, partial [Candidatus Krumholzibacteria bacterium]|nr:hypothetical protein [Candidatus Krumholzibacteria bacterium]
MAALPGLGAALCLAAILCNCSFRPEGKPAINDGDFVEPVASRESPEIWKEIAALRDVVDREPRNPDLHRRLCVLYRLIGTPRSRMLSSEEIDKAIALDPTNASLYVERGLTLIARRFVGEGEASFTHATQLDPACFEAWFQLGRMEKYEYLKTMCFSEHLAKSIEYFEKACRLSRKDEETLVNLAFLHSFRQMHQTGLKYGTRAVRCNPRSSKAHLVCGMLYTENKDFQKAEKEFSTAFLLMSEED